MENPSTHSSWLLIWLYIFDSRKIGFLENSLLGPQKPAQPVMIAFFFFFQARFASSIYCFKRQSITSAFPKEKYTLVSRKCKQSYCKTWHLQRFQEVTICPSAKHTHWNIPVNSFIHLHNSRSLCSNKLGCLKFLLMQTDYKSMA